MSNDVHQSVLGATDDISVLSCSNVGKENFGMGNGVNKLRARKSAMKHAFSTVLGRKKAVRVSLRKGTGGKGFKNESRCSACSKVFVIGASGFVNVGGVKQSSFCRRLVGTNSSHVCVGMLKWPRLPNPLRAVVS